MKKQILKLGNALSRKEQKEVFGGTLVDSDGVVYWGPSGSGQPGGSGLGSGPNGPECNTDSDCCHYQHNASYGYVCSSGVCAPGIFSENPCGL